MTTPSLKVKKTKRIMHSNSIANLIPYPKGVSGNAGSGNGYSLTSALKDKLRKSPELRDQIVDSWIRGVIQREPVPFREALDRIDGKVTQLIGGDADNPLYLAVLERLRGNSKQLTEPQDVVEDDVTNR